MRMAAGAFILGAQTQMSDSVKKFLDIERDGAKGRKGAITRRKKMQIWQDHVRVQRRYLGRRCQAGWPNQAEPR